MNVEAPPSFDTLRRGYVRRYLALEPEEGTSLGLRGGDDRLRSLAPAALAERVTLATQCLAALNAIHREELSANERLDSFALEALARFDAHSLGEREDYLSNLELSVSPYMTVVHHATHAESAVDWRNIGRRAAAVGRYLAEHERHLARGIAEKRGPGLAIAEHFLTHQLPAAASFFERLPGLPRLRGTPIEDDAFHSLTDGARIARDAYTAHAAFLRDRVLPFTTASGLLGEEEYAWRLEHVFGLHTSLDDLVREAEDEVARATSELGASTKPLPKGYPERAADLVPLYASRIERATQFVRDHALFRIPDDLSLGWQEVPQGLSEITHAGNWPAPLLDRAKKGHFLVALDPSRHPVVSAALLAVHEGIPGHYLQSAIWQRTFGQDPAPVRFLRISDDLASAHHYWGPMLNVEGFATYVEERMRQAGFYDPDEARYALTVRAFRAARVVVDIGLHTGRMTRDTVASYLARIGNVSTQEARRQVVRYLRIPTQAMTYFTGAQAIERLKADVRTARAEAWDERQFHDDFFALGPVPPDLARLVWSSWIHPPRTSFRA